MEFEYRRVLAGGSVASQLTHDSEHLRGNPLGDPHLRAHPLLVPECGAAGLPLVVVLVGFTGFGHKVLNKGSLWEENLPERIDRLLAAGSIPPAVYLWPSCETRMGGSQYLDSVGTGAYESMLLHELIPAAEQALGCGGSGRRVVVGKSSGGYGALTLTMRNPGYFAAAGSHAGDMGFDMSHFRGFADALNCWKRYGGPAAFLEQITRLPAIGNLEHAGIEALAMAACYSPNPAAPLGCDLPLDPATGEIHHQVFVRWLEHDPLRMLEQAECVASLRRLQALYLDAGERDEFALQWGLRRFQARLAQLDLPARIEFFDGGHFGMDHRYEASLPFLLSSLTSATVVD